jgi:hypothetical protein
VDGGYQGQKPMGHAQFFVTLRAFRSFFCFLLVQDSTLLSIPISIY